MTKRYTTDHEPEIATGIASLEVGALMGELDVAREVLRQLDEALHPWGEPGVVPDVPIDGGALWACLPGDDPEMAICLEDPDQRRGYTIMLLGADADACDMSEELIQVSRFRVRVRVQGPQESP